MDVILRLSAPRNNTPYIVYTMGIDYKNGRHWYLTEAECDTTSLETLYESIKYQLRLKIEFKTSPIPQPSCNQIDRLANLFLAGVIQDIQCGPLVLQYAKDSHLYKYDPIEFRELLCRNRTRSCISFVHCLAIFAWDGVRGLFAGSASKRR
jgi:hypothetical protein